MVEVYFHLFHGYYTSRQKTKPRAGMYPARVHPVGPGNGTTTIPSKTSSPSERKTRITPSNQNATRGPTTLSQNSHAPKVYPKVSGTQTQIHPKPRSYRQEETKTKWKPPKEHIVSFTLSL
ncbi:hypothetical protein VTJ04DRAFT_1749 [Mycothermus thermophilus]|uniref:uncharacterized protein n=1 Tax=Humicola insolens TaxID=85995 RepID=UPI0037420F52